MAEISKPQDSKQPVTPAVAGNGAKDNARTIADELHPVFLDTDLSDRRPA